MNNIQKAITDPEYKLWISNIEKRFRQQQIKAAVQVNYSKIEFYWSLGRDICEMHVEERWGESVIKQLSEDLRLAIDGAKGLTPGNLYYCKRFYLLYSQLFEKVPQLVEIFPHTFEVGVQKGESQIVPQVGEIIKPLHTIAENSLLPLNIFAIPWGHHKAILDRYDSEPMKALFYAAKTLEHSWSRAVMENQMGDKGKNNGLYERQGKAVKTIKVMVFKTKADIDKFFASSKNYKRQVFQRKIAKALIELPDKSRLRHYFSTKLKEYRRIISEQKEYVKQKGDLSIDEAANHQNDIALQNESLPLDIKVEKKEENKHQLLEVKLKRFHVVDGAITYGKLSYCREGIKAIDHHNFYKVEGRKYHILSDGKSFVFENEEDETDLLQKAQDGHDNYVNEQNKKKELETVRQLIPAAKEKISRGSFDDFYFLKLYRKLYVLIEQEFCLPDYRPDKEKGYHISYGSNGGSWYFSNFHYYYYHKFGESYIKSKIQEERDSEYKKELEYMLGMIPNYEENERNEFLEFLEDYTNSANSIKRMSSYFINWYDEISRYAYDYKNRIFQIDLIKDIALMLSYNMYGDFSAEEEDNVKYYLEIYDRVRGAFLKNERMSLFNEINKINLQKGSQLFDFPKSYSAIVEIEKELKKKNTEKSKTYPESGIVEIPWNCVRFFPGYMFVYHPNHIGGNGYSALRIDDSRIKRSFGEITELLLLRIPPIVAECGNNRVKRIVKMPDLWESIKMLDQPSLIPDYNLLASNIAAKLKGMTIMQVRKLIDKKDSAYMTYLCNRHLEHYCAYYCLEIKINSDLVESDEEGFIFVLKESSNIVNVVYENTLPSRASIIFEIKRESFYKAIKFIHEYLSSSTVNKRELLANHRVDCREHGIINYHHNYHTTIGEWTRRMKRYM